jgi:hypothetical protein
VSSQDILQEELETFNWNDVDIYPSFSNCDTALSKEAKKQCFQNTIAEVITASISLEYIVVSKAINEIVYIDFLIDDRGIPEVLTIEASALLYEEIPELDNMIYTTIATLPKIFPATKRGQHVRTQFRLPLAIRVD